MKTGYIMVEIVESNPAGQIKIKPLCSNCDGKEAWVKPKDILTHMNYIAEEYLKNMPAEELRRALGRKETGMTLKDADKIKEAIKNSDDFVGGSDDIIKVIDSVPEVVIKTDTDTISRQAAIKALDKRFDSIPMEQTKEILLLRRDLRELPSAEPHWISCKKELPKLDSRCVLLYSDYTISGGYYRGNRTFEVDYGDKDVNTMVIAWMPRPEAWEG